MDEPPLGSPNQNMTEFLSGNQPPVLEMESPLQAFLKAFTWLKSKQDVVESFKGHFISCGAVLNAPVLKPYVCF